MGKLTLERAREILAKHTTQPHLFLHAKAVSAAMGAMAEYFSGDKEHWEAIGYLHDVDYEKYPQEHCHHVRELLMPEGVEEGDIKTNYRPRVRAGNGGSGTDDGYRQKPVCGG